MPERKGSIHGHTGARFAHPGRTERHSGSSKACRRGIRLKRSCNTVQVLPESRGIHSAEEWASGQTSDPKVHEPCRQALLHTGAPSCPRECHWVASEAIHLNNDQSEGVGHLSWLIVVRGEFQCTSTLANIFFRPTPYGFRQVVQHQYSCQ